MPGHSQSPYNHQARANIKEKRGKESEDDKWEKAALEEAKKIERRESYAMFRNRGGPKNPGSKKVPVGSPGCLSGLVFVLTGVYESLEREEVSKLVKNLGAKVVTNVSKNTTHMVVGEQAGPSKLQKAALLKTKQISEDELLDLIREKSGQNDVIEKGNTNQGIGVNKTHINVDLETKENLFTRTRTDFGTSSERNLDTSLNMDAILGIRLGTRSNTNMDTVLDRGLKVTGDENLWNEREKRQLINFISKEAGQLGLQVNIQLLHLHGKASRSSNYH